MNKKILSNKRELLKGAGVTALWASPVVTAVLLPAHAVATPTNPGTPPNNDPDLQNLQVQVVYDPRCDTRSNGSPWVAHFFVVTVTSQNGTVVRGLDTKVRHTLFTVFNSQISLNGATRSGETDANGIARIGSGGSRNLSRIRIDYEATVTGPDGREYMAFGSTDAPFGCPGTAGTFEGTDPNDGGDTGGNTPEFMVEPIVNITCPVPGVNDALSFNFGMTITSPTGSSTANLPVVITYEHDTNGGGNSFSGGRHDGTTNSNGVPEFRGSFTSIGFSANPVFSERVRVEVRATGPDGRVYVGRETLNSPYGC